MPLEGIFKKGAIVAGLLTTLLISGCTQKPYYDDEHGYRARVPDGGRTADNVNCENNVSSAARPSSCNQPS
jgi:hypothetical protein